MKQLNIVPAAFKIHHLTNLNTYIVEQDDDLIFHHEIISLPSFMPNAKESIFNLHTEIKQLNNQLYSYTNQWGLTFLGVYFSNTSTYSVIIGPYLLKNPDLYYFTKKHKLSEEQNEELAYFYNQIQLLGEEKIQSFASVLRLFDKIIDMDINLIQININENSHPSEDNLINEDADDIVNLRYEVEAELLHAIGQGDKTRAIELLTSDDLLFSFSERFPNQPLRRVKNLIIVISTLFRTVARQKNVPPILIHRTSEKFAVQIEIKTRLVELHQLQIDMIEEYCELIISSSLSGYSKMIQEVIAYMMTYYKQQITIDDLAAIHFIHPSHLSRKFKQETDMTITAYLQKIRIQQAKHLLKNKSMPIEEISWIVGYGDSSYFTRVFKRETGCTPSQYKEL